MIKYLLLFVGFSTFGCSSVATSTNQRSPTEVSHSGVQSPSNTSDAFCQSIESAFDSWQKRYAVPISGELFTGNPTMYPRIFDTHIHLQDLLKNSAEDVADLLISPERSQEQLRRAICRPGVQGGFILSPTYLQISSLADHNVDSTVQRIEINKAISKLIKNLRRPFYGLCGLDHTSPAVLRVAAECLKLPEFVGFKMRRLSINADPQNALYLEKFVSSLHLLSKKGGGVALVHFEETAASQKDVSLLLEIMSDFPTVNLIIAHSGLYTLVGLKGLSQIGQYFRDNPNLRRNVYMEISTSDMLMGLIFVPPASRWTDSGAKNLIQSWKDFGLDYVLYGSDVPQFYRPHIDDAPLTETEKQNIYYKNALKLLEPWNK